MNFQFDERAVKTAPCVTIADKVKKLDKRFPRRDFQWKMKRFPNCRDRSRQEVVSRSLFFFFTVYLLRRCSKNKNLFKERGGRPVKTFLTFTGTASPTLTFWHLAFRNLRICSRSLLTPLSNLSIVGKCHLASLADSSTCLSTRRSVPFVWEVGEKRVDLSNVIWTFEPGPYNTPPSLKTLCAHPRKEILLPTC